MAMFNNHEIKTIIIDLYNSDINLYLCIQDILNTTNKGCR